MNDVINSRGYTEAEWLNRIPVAGWMLMAFIAICCNVLLGYGAKHRRTFLLVVLPLVIAVAFFLIAEIDSPRGGLIRVVPVNLLNLGHSFPT
jgi:apolipoprotein N-acyltransferase